MKAPDTPLQERLLAVQRELFGAQERADRELTLVAVSKTKPDDDLLAAYDSGQRDFGENRVKELVGKAERLPQDIRWHMIGHIQTNKIKDFLSFSVNSACTQEVPACVLTNWHWLSHFSPVAAWIRMGSCLDPYAFPPPLVLCAARTGPVCRTFSAVAAWSLMAWTPMAFCSHIFSWILVCFGSTRWHHFP